jgi:hypothetical protein
MVQSEVEINGKKVTIISMLEYRIITGWYPSKETAEKVLSKAKAFNKNARVIEGDIFYGVIVDSFEDLEKARAEKDRLISKGLYCGIEVS